MEKKPFVSLIIPTYNEEKYIQNCINSLLRNTYPSDLVEIIVVDGMSTDKTVTIVKEIASKHSNIIVIENPRKIAPVAMNLGIKRAKGDIILRIDAHADYQEDYIEQCVYLLEKYNAWNVGGCIDTKPSGKGIVSKSIALALSHKFGVGNSAFRTIKQEMEVDTVPFGAFPKYVFDQVGLYNEKLVRNQDIELNSRIRKNGGKIILSPKIRCSYYARENYKGLWNQNYNNGKWNIFTQSIASYALSIRHFVPLFFVLSLLLGVLLIPFSVNLGLFLLATTLIPYLVLSLFYSGKIAIKEMDFRLLFVQPVTFLVLHFSYGFGSIIGLIKVKKFLRSINNES